ncbi:MAG: arginine deiminase-related protein [Chloroherpetonaceae bacterium]|nr:arginine deiminase-related protein [Chthonomonadaceae bacterium]MDW8209065.1 arginine deiminase-related protein [Chloroherpetonaceae bacterium]
MSITVVQEPEWERQVDTEPRPTRLLMCAPTQYALRYEINPWMVLENQPDLPLATRQWQELYRILTEQVGAQVELIEQAPEAPDMVFTANAGLVRGRYVLLANFRHPQRQVEEPHFRRWFEENGYHVQLLPVGCKFEGEGDALFVGDTLVAGYLKRSDICSHRHLSDYLAVPVLSLELVDDRWYHLDTCLFALSADTVVYYPGAFDAYARTVIQNHFETIEVCEEEALRFACNSVVIGNQVVMPAGCPRIASRLEARGYRVHSVDLSEFLKAGGAAKCLTLFLR